MTAGATYHTNRVSISVNHGIQFLLNGRGYQSVTSGSISIRIGSLVVNAQATADPFGRTLWSGWGESYTQTGIRVPEGRGYVAHSSHGKYLITGKCLEDGKPVEGCAVLVGKGNREIVFSNRRGDFELHVKKNVSVQIAVSLDDFTATGTWRVISVPATSKPGESVTVIVERQ